jgi:protein O-mannosyl-transferase
MSKRRKSLNDRAVQERPRHVATPGLDLRALCGIVIIAASVFLAYLPAINGDFVWDDDKLVTENVLVKAPDGLSRIWCTNQGADFWPVTNSAFWLEWRLWKMNPAGYHATNLILHIAEALLVWLILRRLSIPGAYLAALIFALHPVNVESVAWIAQLKNLMAMLLFLLSILWYLKGIRVVTGIRPDGARHATTSDLLHPSCFISHPSCFYWLSLAAFILAMLGKGSVVVMPVLLLGIIWWLRPVRWQDFAWISPFFIFAVILTKVNLWFQVHGTDTVVRTASFLDRFLSAVCAIWFYLYKAIFPLNLAPVYPQWHIEPGNLLWWLPLLFAFGVTAVLWLYRNGWSRPFLFAWGFFCIALVPVMGFADVGFMKFTLVADRYQHIAVIGVIALAASGFAIWRRVGGVKCWAVAALAVVILGFMTWEQCGIYCNSIILNQTTLEKNPDFWLGHYNLGVALYDAGRMADAARQYELVIRDQPDYSDALCNLAHILIRNGRYQEAIDHLKVALRIHPDDPAIQNNMGWALLESGHPQESIRFSKEAVRLIPDVYKPRCHLADALFDTGQFAEAVEQYEQAIRLEPDHPESEYNLGVALNKIGRPQEAVDHFEKAIKLRPNYAEVHNHWAATLFKMGRPQEAIDHYNQALSLKPDLLEAQFNLAVAYANMRQSSQAIAAAQRALDLARSQGHTAFAKQIENWLNTYRANLPNLPTAPSSTDSRDLN